MVVLYWPAMFAGGAVGAVGLLPALHAVNDPIAVAIANHFILPLQTCLFTISVSLVQLEGRFGRILRGACHLAASMMLRMPITRFNKVSGLL